MTLLYLKGAIMQFLKNFGGSPFILNNPKHHHIKKSKFYSRDSAFYFWGFKHFPWKNNIVERNNEDSGYLGKPSEQSLRRIPSISFWSKILTWQFYSLWTKLKQISHLVGDIKNIFRNIRNIRFSYCNRTTNILTDRVEKRSPYCPLYKM